MFYINKHFVTTYLAISLVGGSSPRPVGLVVEGRGQAVLVLVGRRGQA